jgi:hypothetical protein
MRIKIAIGIIAAASIMLHAQEAPLGTVTERSKDEQKALDALKGKVEGRIVWSTSRVNSKHDIYHERRRHGPEAAHGKRQQRGLVPAFFARRVQGGFRKEQNGVGAGKRRGYF